jgi:hypothetical protein
VPPGFSKAAANVEAWPVLRHATMQHASDPSAAATTLALCGWQGLVDMVLHLCCTTAHKPVCWISLSTRPLGVPPEYPGIARGLMYLQASAQNQDQCQVQPR